MTALRVLDIETALDRAAVRRTARADGSAFLCPCLHRVTAASLLQARIETTEGRFTDLQLESWLAADPVEEAALLSQLAAALDSPEPDSVLVTFNGRQHDLPILALRSLRHWRFDVLQFEQWLEASTDHVDLMQSFSRDGSLRWPALGDLCAVFDIPMTHAATPAPPDQTSLIKNQGDVCATFLLYCVHRASAARSAIPLLVGWAALGDYLLARTRLEPHFSPFVTGSVAALARARNLGL